MVFLVNLFNAVDDCSKPGTSTSLDMTLGFCSIPKKAKPEKAKPKAG